MQGGRARGSDGEVRMSRKQVVVSGGVLLFLAAGVAGTLLALYHTPTFYAAALTEPADPQVRKQQAKKFVQTTMQLVDGIRNANRWSEEFNQEQVNSWLAEELPGKYRDWLPDGVREPRVRFDEGTFELAFQYDKGTWRGVVSGKVRPWVAGPGEIALEIQSLRAGLVPIPLDEVLEEVSTELNNVGWRIEWKQSAGNDVLVVHLDNDDPDRPQLDAIQLRPQTLRISGRRPTDAVAEQGEPNVR